MEGASKGGGFGEGAKDGGGRAGAGHGVSGGAEAAVGEVRGGDTRLEPPWGPHVARHLRHLRGGRTRLRPRRLRHARPPRRPQLPQRGPRRPPLLARRSSGGRPLRFLVLLARPNDVIEFEYLDDEVLDELLKPEEEKGGKKK
uniref:Uncharacterized protein n=1 Tax=Ananas comosus var. bracteatus TaxID=296719 RepID=A0A6V7QDD8_ANACO|nr:unnamed protein product [Ananas comosus var. bracteatus]